MKSTQIAVDGPAGAGKSTAARMLASRLQYLYVDTGAMYRALTHKALVQGLDLDDAAAMNMIASNTELSFRHDDFNVPPLVYCDGEDVTEAIRQPSVSNNVSRVARIPGVRLRMVRLQRQMAASGNVVMDGRDIGSFVLPDAAYKFFLTASLAERVRRRYLELRQKGIATDPEHIMAEIKNRDRIDSQREVAPLVAAPDAIIIDTSNLTVEGVVERMLAICRGGNQKSVLPHC